MNINAKIEHELKNPASEGGRHSQMCKIAIGLIECGLVPDAVEVQFNKTYGDDIESNEIKSIIRWAVQKANQRPSSYIPTNRPIITPEDQLRCAEDFLGNFRVRESQVSSVSPVAINPNFKLNAVPFLQSLYQGTDLINIVTSYYIDPLSEKAFPCGAGMTRTRDAWIDQINAGNFPHGKAGTRIRMNPVKPTGSGQNGAYTGDDIASCSHLLVEADQIPLIIQLSLLATLPLPIKAIIFSGNKSYHAWIENQSKSRAEFEDNARKILSRLMLLGFDENNKSPLKLSWLPGGVREIGGHDKHPQQRLIYLNPTPTSEPILKKE